MGSSGIFEKEKKQTPIVIEAFPGQRDMLAKMSGAALPGALERIGTLGDPYEGKLTAGMSKFEDIGMDTLAQYLNSPGLGGNELFTAAKGEALSTLQGDKYDPSEGDYYKAFRSAVQIELQDAKDRIAARTSANDMFFGGGRIKAEGDVETDTMNTLVQFLGQLSLRERENRMGMVPLAASLGQMEDRSPLDRIAASQTFGALPRMLEQEGLDREYTEYQRQLNDLNIALSTIQQLGGLNQYMSSYTPQTVNKPWVNDTAGIMDIITGLGSLKGK